MQTTQTTPANAPLAPPAPRREPRPEDMTADQIRRELKDIHEYIEDCHRRPDEHTISLLEDAEDRLDELYAELSARPRRLARASAAFDCQRIIETL